MNNEPALIDFKELVSPVQGEGLEQLTRHLGNARGMIANWSGRGPDQGRDLLFTEDLSGPISRREVKWLVSCKDHAVSGASVTENDLPAGGILEKVRQHDADGFLLVTTTAPSSGAKALLDSLDMKGEIRTAVWDSTDLNAMLIEPVNHKILKQFLPKSYERVQGLTSLEGAILKHADRLPQDVVAQMLELIRPYSMELQGSQIWPHDHASAAAIDEIVKALLVDKDIDDCIKATKNIRVDAFVAMLERIHEKYPSECRSYLEAVILNHHDHDLKLNSVQFLVDRYEITPPDNIKLAFHLDAAALQMLFGTEIAIFVQDELMQDPADYELWSDIDEMSSNSSIEDASVSDLEFRPASDEMIEFSGWTDITVSLTYDHEHMGEFSVPGEFKGYFDAAGMYLTSATVDTTSFYEGHS